MMKLARPNRLTVALVVLIALLAGWAGPGTASADPPGPSDQAEDLAAKPYLGWSSYSMQVYAGNGSTWITADQIIAQSDAMHEKLQPFGYEYINVDAAWNGGVDDYGRPVPSTTLYPDGLQTVIDHVHGNGQKFGLYFIPGMSPDLYENPRPIFGAEGCDTREIVKQPVQQADYWGIGYRLDFDNPCAQKWVDSVVDLIAGWGVDFVKFDSVTPGSGISDLSLDARDDVAAWSKALHRHGIWFELSWALDIKYADYWKQYADGWRVEWDVECYCEGEALTQWANIARLFPRAADWWRHAGPNSGWNDFDSLNVGNGSMDGLTQNERRTATTLWAISAAPMYLGNDLTRLDTFGLGLLTNPEVIAVHQAGTPAQPVSTTSNRQTWYSLNSDGSYTVALFNLGRTTADVTANWADLGLTGQAQVRDLWSRKNLGRFDTGFTAQNVPIHGVRLLQVTPNRGATVTVDDDTLRVGYQGDWKRNDGREQVATTQPLKLAVWDSAGGGTEPEPPASGSTMIVNDDDQGIVYNGSWGDSGGRGLGDHNDDVHFAEADGAFFEYTFQGTGISYLTELHESQGDVDIYLDGEFKETVSTYLDPAEGRKAQQVVYRATGLPDGTHTLRAVKKSGSYMLLDRLDVTRNSLLTPDTGVVDRADPNSLEVALKRDPGELAAITRDGEPLVVGTDYVIESGSVIIDPDYLAGLPVGQAELDFSFRGDHGDDVHATTKNGDAVSLTFTGSGVEWITALGPDQGTAEVYVDGRLAEEVDLSHGSRVTGQRVFGVTGLRYGEHTIKVVKTSGDVLRHDVFRYQQR